MPRSGGGGGLRFPLFGFPVAIHPSFLVIALLLGISGPEPDLGRALVWIGVVLVSVLVHELGHAFAARTVGAEPTIDLYALGGLTAFSPPRPLNRLQSIGISLAGPFAGFLLGAAVLSAAAAFGVERSGPFLRSGAPLVDTIVSASIWVNIYWGAVNLLPILPLDGGNVVRSMLPGNDDTRDRLATVLSLAVAVVLVIVLLRSDYAGLILLPILLGAINLSSLMTNRGSESNDLAQRVVPALASLERGEPGSLRTVAELAAQTDPPVADRIKITSVEILVRQGRINDARQVLTHMAGKAHPALYALVDVASGDPHGVTMLDEMVRAQPSPPVARYALLARLLQNRATDIPTIYLGLPPEAQQIELLREMQYLAHTRGDFVAAASIGELQLSFDGSPDPWVLYNTACSWSRAGQTEQALHRLGQAVDAGWTDAEQLDGDQDLAPLWGSDRFRDIRRRLAPTPLI